MQKKLLYIYALTISFAIANAYILFARWGLTFGNASFSRILKAYERDSVMTVLTLAATAVYLLLFAKVLSIKTADKAPKYKPSTAVYGEPLLEAQGRGLINPNDAKWKNIYNGAPSAAQIVKQESQEPKEPEYAPIETPEVPTRNSNPIVSAALRAAAMTKASSALSSANYENLGAATINGHSLDFVAIADSDIMVLGVIDPTSGTISAADDHWFAEDKRYDSPVNLLSSTITSVKKMMRDSLGEDYGIDVLGIVVLSNGSLVAAPELPDNIKVAKLAELKDSLPERTDEVLESYRRYAKTMLDYFSTTKKAA